MKLTFNVLLTSFYEARKMKMKNKFSVARNKPAWAKGYKELKFLAPIDAFGNAIRLSNFPGDPMGGYSQALKQAYLYRWQEIKAWLGSLDKEHQYILCCWCPHSKPSKMQIENYGSFACHTMLLEKTIKKNRPDLIVKSDQERTDMAYPGWR